MSHEEGFDYSGSYQRIPPEGRPAGRSRGAALGRRTPASHIFTLAMY